MTKPLTIAALCALIVACQPKPEPVTWPEQDIGHINAEIIDLAATIRCESQGEIKEGEIAVGQITMARVRSDQFPDTVGEVVRQKNQYSCWKPSSPVHWKVKDVLNNPDATRNAGFIHLAELIYWNVLPDVIDEAMFYMNAPKASAKGRQWQLQNTVPVRTIGNHQFRKGV